MAKFLASYDTLTQQFELTKDGVKVEDVCCVEFYGYPSIDGDKIYSGSVTIETNNFNKEDKISTTTKVYARDGKDIEEKIVKQDLHKEIAELIFPKRK
jgi:hypothetical protein